MDKLLSGKDSVEGTTEADSVAEAISSLNVKSDKDEEKTEESGKA